MSADLSTAVSSPHLHGLNAEQRAAVEAVSGPVCILAGAGSGKTRTITHRIAHQIFTGAAAPEEILAVTFTDKAAGELRHRLAAMGLPRPVRAATFHSAAWAQIRYFWPRVNGSAPPDVLTSKVPLLLPVAKRLGVEARDLASEIEWAKARRLDPDAYRTQAAGRDAPVDPARMAELYARYEQTKEERGLLDYEDMLLVAERLISADPSVAETVRRRYRFFTVDEFQDVNPAQWALLRAWLGESRDVCVVGDDDQTIFSFTGASASYLVGFRSHFPDARLITLSDNYRSSAQVLRLANRVLGDGAKRLRAQGDGGPKPVVRGFSDDRAERDGVVASIRGLLEAGVAPGEIAVCYRVNSQSEPWEQALADAGIPATVRGEGGFFARPEIRQALRVLRAGVEQGTHGGDGDVPPPGGAVRTRPPAANRAVERILRSQLSWHPTREPQGQAARERWRNIAGLAAFAERAVEEAPDVTLEEVVDELWRRAAAGDATPDDAGAVTLLTYHKAKGLEFDAVYLVACEEGLMPISHARTDEEFAEERRLLYVGITRARRHLWLSWAESRPGWGGKPTRRRRSRFLDGVALPPSGATKAGRADQRLATRLRQWRLERSRRDGVPAYVVFSDRTLDELAVHRPTTHRALLAVHGVGPTKVQRYGDDLLQILKG